MNINEFKKFYHVARSSDTPVFIWGHGGVGKSSVMFQLAKEEGNHIVSMNLSQIQDVGDFLGITEFDHNTFDVTTSNFATPKWLVDLNSFAKTNPDKQAILFLDELNRGRPDIINVVLTMITARLVGTYKLEPNVIITGAGNYETKNYGTTKTRQDFALQTRFCHINLNPSVNEFTDYMRTKHGTFLASFLTKHPEVANAHLKLETPTVSGQASNRTIDMALGLVNKALEQELNSDTLMEGLIGLVGVDVATHLNAYLKSKEGRPLSGEEALNNFNEHKENLVKWSNVESGRPDLMVQTLDNVMSYLRSNVLNNKQTDNLVSLIDLYTMDIIKSNFKEYVLQYNDNENIKENWTKIAPVIVNNTEFFKKLETFQIREAIRQKGLNPAIEFDKE